jgi:hypothetical protein
MHLKEVQKKLMTHHTAAQPQNPKIPNVAVPLKWHPPNDHLDSANFEAWTEQQLQVVPEPRRWLAGLLASLNEIQIRQAIDSGQRLITIDSPLPHGWTTLIIGEAVRRLENAGYEVPCLSVNVDTGAE